MERDSARAKNPSPVFSNRVRFSARPNRLKNPCNRDHSFHPGPKKEHKHAHRLGFRASVNLEIYVLRTCWNWACNRNNISARWAERNFSPGWNSPCNQDPRKMKPLPLNSEEYGQAISQAIEGRHCMEPTTSKIISYYYSIPTFLLSRAIAVWQ